VVYFSNIIRDEDKLFLTYLDNFATKSDYFKIKGASVYLYEILSNQYIYIYIDKGIIISNTLYLFTVIIIMYD
jgi:hypothetical protein